MTNYETGRPTSITGINAHFCRSCTKNETDWMFIIYNVSCEINVMIQNLFWSSSHGWCGETTVTYDKAYVNVWISTNQIKESKPYMWSSAMPFRATGQAMHTGTPSSGRSRGTRATSRSPPRLQRSCSKRTRIVVQHGCPSSFSSSGSRGRRHAGSIHPTATPRSA